MTLTFFLTRRTAAATAATIRRQLFSTRPLSKVVGSAKEALAGINLNGATVAVGGFGLGGNPETLLNELSSTAGANNLVVASLTGGVDGFGLGKLMEAGKVRRLISSYVGENKCKLFHSLFCFFFDYLLVAPRNDGERC